jgi:flagellar biosynthesis/type III secretory pathway protein FliH
MSSTRLFASLAASALLLAPHTAFAQRLGPRLPAAASSLAYAREAQAPYTQVRRHAYDQGYREGYRRGEEDGRRGDRFRYEDERDYRNADKGYHRSYGDRDRYRQIFRDGFAAGYADGYNRYARYGRNTRPPVWGSQRPYGQQGGYGSWGRGSYSPAFDNGVRDGYEKGREDARKNRSFDPVRHSWYRGGDRHYEREYGSREQYKDVYRRGFQEGYERGYREGRYR